MKKCLLACMFSLALCIGFTACEAQTELPSEVTLTPAPTPEVSEEKARYYSDYDYLWSVIENEFGLMDVAENLTDEDFEAIKEGHRFRIEYITSDEMFFNEAIAPALGRFQSVGHMGVIDSSWYPYIYEIYTSLDDDTPGLNSTTLSLPQVQNFYTGSVDGAEQFISTDTQGVAVDSNESLVSDNLEFAYYPENSTAYVKIKNMTQPEENDDAITLENFFSEIESQGYEKCVIDLSQNPGGTDLYWHNNILAPNMKTALGYDAYSLIKGDLGASYLELEKGLTISAIEDFPEELFPNLSEAVLAEFKYFNKNTIALGYEEYPQLFSGEFYVLVGETTYSSASSFVRFCQETGFATIVGGANEGAGGGFDPMIIALPETGILFRLDVDTSINADGSFGEEVGIVADIEVPNGEAFVTRCLEAIWDKSD